MSLECAELGEFACAADTRCKVVDAQPAEEDGGRAAKVFIACLASDGACLDGDAETCASETAGGVQYLFPTTCIPPAWVVRDFEDCN